MSRILAWNEAIKADLPTNVAVTERTREAVQAQATRFRGSVRLATGRIYTDAEYEERRTRVLNTKLP